jgi:archaellum component FlaF (FlaF/FlaG flagellin family)
MRKSLKIASAALILFLALSAVAFVYAGMQNSLALADEQQTGNQNMQTFFDSNNITLPSTATWPGHMGRGHGRQMMGDGLPLVQMLSENATLSTVQGTVVAQSRGILILDTGSGQVRVTIPNEWTVGSEVINSTALFNGTFVSSGQTLAVNVLKSDLFSNANFSVNVMLGYEAVNAAGTHAYAVLPFNIQPTS